VGVVAIASACNDGGDASGASGEQSSESTAASSFCADMDADEFSAGMVKQGTALSVVLVESLPAPPTRGDNAWTVELRDAAQAPVSGATIVVTPWMELHGHGANKMAVVTDEGDGRYSIAPVNLYMQGVWRITIDIAMPEPVGGQDEVIFYFCVE
jgi:hypothetical protein